MELKQLQYFRAVAKQNSISQAADSLYITQPALSRCIKRLEDEIGVALLERMSNGVKLTPAGEAFLIELDQAFMHFELGLKNARLTMDQKAPRLTIVNSFEDFDFGVIEQMHKAFPDVQASIDTLPPSQAYRELLAGQADFAVIPWANERAGIVYEHLLSEEMLLSSSDRHALFGKPFITLEELDGCTCVCNEVVFDWDSIMQICDRHHITLKLLLSSNDHQTVGRFKGLMDSNMFVPISATMSREPDDRRELTYPARIVPQVFRRNVYLAYHEGKHMSSAEKYFIELLRGCYRQKGQAIQSFSVQQFGRVEN